MSTTTDTTPATALRSPAVIIACAFLFVVLVLGLVYLAGPTGRTETLTWLTGVFSLVASVVGGAAVYQNRKLSTSVETVRTQTNGSLDKRIQDAISSALAAVGVTPQTPVLVTPQLVAPTTPAPVVPAVVSTTPAPTVSAPPAPVPVAVPAPVLPAPAVNVATFPVAPFAPADALSHVPAQPGPTAGS